MTKYHYPCTPDCPRRKPGCHGRCKEFLDAKAKDEKISEARRREYAEAEYHMQAAAKNKYKTIKDRMK